MPIKFVESGQPDPTPQELRLCGFVLTDPVDIYEVKLAKQAGTEIRSVFTQGLGPVINANWSFKRRQVFCGELGPPNSQAESQQVVAEAPISDASSLK
jgi:hypothetical protein